MKRRFLSFVSTLALGSLVTVGCTQAAPAPTPVPPAPTKAAEQPRAAEPTKAPAAPTKAPEPTKAPAQPTAVPAKKVDFPQKGRAITVVVPYAPGGGGDVSGRMFAADMEKELGVPVEVVNKAGAGSQVGVTEAVRSRPDGYTIGYAALPTTKIMYLDPERKTVYSRKDFVPLGLQHTDPASLVVLANSPYKDFKELLDAAKAKPEQIKIGVSGQLNSEHLDILRLQQSTGARFGVVVFDGAGPAMTAVLGGHIDAVAVSLGSTISSVKSNQTRLIATFGEGGGRLVPGAKSMKELGFPGMFSNHRVYFLPAGTPKEIVDILAAGMKRAVMREDHQKKSLDMAQLVDYMGPEELARFWDELEATAKPLMELAKREMK